MGHPGLLLSGKCHAMDLLLACSFGAVRCVYCYQVHCLGVYAALVYVLVSGLLLVCWVAVSMLYGDSAAIRPAAAALIIAFTLLSGVFKFTSCCQVCLHLPALLLPSWQHDALLLSAMSDAIRSVNNVVAMLLCCCQEGLVLQACCFHMCLIL